MLRISWLSGLFLSILIPTEDSQQAIKETQTNKGRAPKNRDPWEMGYLATLPDKQSMPDEILS